MPHLFEKTIFRNRNQVHYLDKYVLDENSGSLQLFLLDNPGLNDPARIVVVFAGINNFKKEIHENEEEANDLQLILGIDEYPKANGRFLVVIATDICEMEFETNGLPSITEEKVIW